MEHACPSVFEEQLLETTRHERHHHLHRRAGHVPVTVTRPRRHPREITHRNAAHLVTNQELQSTRPDQNVSSIRTSPRSAHDDAHRTPRAHHRHRPRPSTPSPSTRHPSTPKRPGSDRDQARPPTRPPSLDDTTRSPVMTSSVDTPTDATADHSIDASRRSNSPTYRHPRPSVEDERLVAPRRDDQTAQGMPRPEI